MEGFTSATTESQRHKRPVKKNVLETFPLIQFSWCFTSASYEISALTCKTVMVRNLILPASPDLSLAAAPEVQL